MRSILGRSCNTTSPRLASTSFLTPLPTVEGGPALRFFYRAAASVTAPKVSIGGGASATLDSSTWTEKVLCLDPAQGGRTSGVSFLLGVSGVCANPITPAAELFVDEVSLGVDPSCPGL